MPSRRAYLGTVATVGLAGCTEARSGGSTTQGSPPESAGVKLVDASVAYSVRHVLNVDHNGVYTVDGRQFVFAVVDDSGGDAHSLSSFALVADGEQYPATTFAEGEPHDLGSTKRAYRRDDEPYETGRRGWFCFVVPEQLDTAPTLHLDADDGTWAWTLDGLERATMPPPEWEWTVTVPETVPPNSTFEIELSATNVGDGPGRFRAAVNFKNALYQPKTVGIPLAPGESGTGSVEAESGQAGELYTYGVRTAAGDTDLEVPIAAESETPARTDTETD